MSRPCISPYGAGTLCSASCPNSTKCARIPSSVPERQCYTARPNLLAICISQMEIVTVMEKAKWRKRAAVIIRCSSSTEVTGITLCNEPGGEGLG